MVRDNTELSIDVAGALTKLFYTIEDETLVDALFQEARKEVE
jgi:hypothetical protein